MHNLQLQAASKALASKCSGRQRSASRPGASAGTTPSLCKVCNSICGQLKHSAEQSVRRQTMQWSRPGESAGRRPSCAITWTWCRCWTSLTWRAASMLQVIRICLLICPWATRIPLIQRTAAVPNSGSESVQMLEILLIIIFALLFFTEQHQCDR